MRKMSRLQFIASDIPLTEVKNPFIELLSINTAIGRGIEIASFVMDNPKIDRDNDKILVNTQKKGIHLHLHGVTQKKERNSYLNI
jgi:hypothetical protein